MNNQTFERFQGLWWGGIVGQALANHKYNSGATINSLEFPSQNWLRERQQIAQFLLYRSEFTSHSPKEPAVIDSPSATINHQQQLQGLTDGDRPLKLLALIFLPERLSILEAADYTINSDILIWYRLIQLILSRNPGSLELAMVFKQTQQSLDCSSDLLLNLLQSITQCVEQGISLQQLRGELGSNADLQQMAIAYSWYCFLATPQDFKLSVLRATNIDSPIATVTAALTATLSGAYNGITRIPLNWRIRISQHPKYVEEERVLSKLFKTWLGIYDLTSQQESFNQRIDAVASFSTLQPRKTLNLISQESV